jgi:hypothetical protein
MGFMTTGKQYVSDSNPVGQYAYILEATRARNIQSSSTLLLSPADFSSGMVILLQKPSPFMSLLA